MQFNILAIESSCDETSAAVICGGVLRSNLIATQDIHRQYGGVVPELASREHQKNIVPVVETALKQAGITKKELHAVAFTQGPGLLGSLLVGAAFAKGLAMSLQIPLIGVHHMKAHILAHFIEEPRPQFPFLCLTVSGGHTQLVVVKSPLDMEIVGQTQDDAVGEAFDKAAKMLELPYPGGPLIDKYAQQGNPKAFKFPKASVPGLNFSFSGLKTSFLYFLRDQLKENPAFTKERMPDICASIQHTLVEVLMEKLIEASELYQIKHVGIAGGVSANSLLRSTLEKVGAQRGWQVYIPQFQYCTDNAGMIAIAAHYQFLAQDFAPVDVSPSPRLPF
jgi:N6-L-threonylcarbamoyladenine synthase